MADRDARKFKGLEELRAAFREAKKSNIGSSKVTTPEQRDANRVNAQSSTGPKTEGGRERSSRNAFKHGLTAKKIVVGTEQEEDLTEFCAGIMLELKPEGAVEEALAEAIALGRWKLRRIYAYEAGMTREARRQITSDLPEVEIADGAEYNDLLSCQSRNGLVHLSRHETALARRIREDTAELERLQARRKEAARRTSANENTDAFASSANPTIGSAEPSRVPVNDIASACAPSARVRRRTTTT